MGSFVSKNDEDSPDCSTPGFERYSYSKSLDEDPRSPAADDVTRTPIISYDKVNDPRSPAQYERTPVFAIPEPSTPEIKYQIFLIYCFVEYKQDFSFFRLFSGKEIYSLKDNILEAHRYVDFLRNVF